MKGETTERNEKRNMPPGLNSVKVITHQGGKNSTDNLLMDEMLVLIRITMKKYFAQKIGGRCLNDETEVLLPGSILLYSRKNIK